MNLLIYMLDEKTIKSLYYQMLRLRMVEEVIASEYPKQEMRCPTHLCIGQEAIATGVCFNLEKKDVVLSNHRSHGHYLAKGGNLKAMIAEIYGKKTGCSLGRGGSQHLIDLSVNFLGATPIVGETIPVAVGTALATHLKNKDRITVIFFGDAAVEEGVTHESLNFASLHKLPILFVCENNFYSVNTPISQRQPKRDIFSLSQAHKVTSYQEDGNNVLKTYAISKKAIRRLRKKQGPVFIEFITYRYREHCGPYFEPKGIRPKDELEKYLKQDPILQMRRYVLAENILNKEEIKTMGEEIGKEIGQAFKFARESPYPDEKVEDEQVYA